MAGTWGTVLSRIVPALALVALVVAGCGGGSPPHHRAAHGVPRALAREWARQASAVAGAVAAGDSCRAQQLAADLRDDVIAAEGRVPARLQKPLVTGVNALADRLTCVTPPQTVTVAPPTPPKPKPPPHDRHHHGGRDHGQGGDQGGNG
jgi:hypothetical protein